MHALVQVEGLVAFSQEEWSRLVVLLECMTPHPSLASLHCQQVCCNIFCWLDLCCCLLCSTVLYSMLVPSSNCAAICTINSIVHAGQTKHCCMCAYCLPLCISLSQLQLMCHMINCTSCCVNTDSFMTVPLPASLLCCTFE